MANTLLRRQKKMILSFTNSKISPLYAICLANSFRSKPVGKKFSIGLSLTKPRGISSRNRGIDSNAISRQEKSPATALSARGYMLGGWKLDAGEEDMGPCETLPREGRFERRPVLQGRKCVSVSIGQDEVEMEALCEQKSEVVVSKDTKQLGEAAKKNEELPWWELRKLRISMERKGSVSGEVEEKTVEEMNVQQEIDTMAGEK